MHSAVLIDLVVSQMTVLIAQIVTRSGARLPLAHVADEVFRNLARELQDHGVPQKVVADMFGLALRGFQMRIRRLEERLDDEDRTLSMRVLNALEESKGLSRAQVQELFVEEDDATLRAVLRDLCDSGLVEQAGKRDAPSYVLARASTTHTAGDEDRERASLQDMVVVFIYGSGPSRASAIACALRVDRDDIEDALDALVLDGRILLERDEQGNARYVARTYRVTAGGSDGQGWEAAVFDHVRSMSATIIRSLQLSTGDPRRQVIGGGTYAFDVWEGHPMYDDVMKLLESTRAQASALRQAVQNYNSEHGMNGDVTRVSFYCGQHVVEGYTDE